MRARTLVLAAMLGALAVPAAARAGDVAMRVQEIPLGPRSLASAVDPMHFNMLALHWVGRGSVAYRVRRLHGGWGAWQTADADVAPDGGTGAWRDGNLDWTGGADGVRFRTRGEVRRLRAYELWSRVTTAPRALASAGPPAIVTRAQWGANEDIVRAKPLFAPAIKLAVVHHTAGTNDYTPAQAAAIVRGIEEYHVLGNGWNDIGYNFLVDRFGNVYEGRAGGITRNVIGAHAEGFNRGTVGVALIGNYSAATPPKAQQDALVRLLAWRLDVAHVDPLSTVVYTSGGNAKFPAGKLVTLRAISGHRDTGPSECPGNGAYALLPSVARRVAATGLPKLYGPTVAGILGGPIRFQARLSAALSWQVTVTGPAGAVVARGTGHGTTVDWTWASPPAAAGSGYAWTISAPGALAATGTLGSLPAPAPPPGLAVTAASVSPDVLAPAPDGTGGASTVSYTLGAAAQVTVELRTESGTLVRTLLAPTPRPAGASTLAWDARSVRDGRYQVVVTAAAAGATTSGSADVVVDRTLTGLEESLSTISPNGDGIADGTVLSFVLSQDVPIRVDVEQAGIVVATPFSDWLPAGAQTLTWDGTNAGTPLPDGAYSLVLTWADQLGSVSLSLPVTIDTTPPVLTLLDAQSLRFSLSEPATVTLVIDWSTTLVVAEPKGTFTVPWSGTVSYLSATARDAVGNASATVTWP